MDLIETTLASLESKDFLSAEESCLSYLEQCMEFFMENLTVNTGTDYFAAVVLLGRIYVEMKKPWKIFPVLEAAKGCLRFLDDFMQDRRIVSQAMKSAAEFYAHGGYFPESVEYYRKEFERSVAKEEAEDALFHLYFYGFRSNGKVLDEHRECGRNKIGDVAERAVYQEASLSYDSQIQTDPVEREDCYLNVRFSVEADVDDVLSRQESEDGLPYCIRYWRTKKEILSQKYGIDWMSPEECNPSITFCDKKRAR